MSTEVSERLGQEGGRLIFSGMPVGTEVGIDMNIFRVGPRFQGFRGIPPGIHFIFYSAVGNRFEGLAPRNGFFHFFHSGDVVVRKWDQKTEDIEDGSISEDALRHLKDTEERHLGLYPYETWRQWVSLTDHLTWPLVQRLQPENGKISAATQLTPLVYPVPQDTVMEVQRLERLPKQSLEDQLLPQMKPLPGTELRFTTIPERAYYPEGATPGQISQHCIDSTYTLERIIGQESISWDDMLGELQLSFICFLVGGVYESFDQWRRILRLLTSCESAIGLHPSFYSDMMGVLHFQLKEVPHDFFVDIVEAENFLCSALSRFFSNLNNSGSAPGDLKAKGKRFQKSLTKTFRWRFDLEEDDDAPVIVTLAPDTPITHEDVEVEQ